MISGNQNFAKSKKKISAEWDDFFLIFQAKKTERPKSSLEHSYNRKWLHLKSLIQIVWWELDGKRRKESESDDNDEIFAIASCWKSSFQLIHAWIISFIHHLLPDCLRQKYVWKLKNYERMNESEFFGLGPEFYRLARSKKIAKSSLDFDKLTVFFS